MKKLFFLRKNEDKILPLFSLICLGIIVIGCLLAELFMNHDPTFMDLKNFSLPPNKEFYFGTDSMGRDIYSMIWYGGRISLFIGVMSTMLSTGIALIYGSISGLASSFVDKGMMKFVELLISMPSILLIIFIQGIMGQSSIKTIAVMIGCTSWMNLSKVIRSEVKQLKNCEYVLAARSIGGSYFYIIRRHFIKGLIPAIMFMVVSNFGAAVGTEAVLSFLGIGLPIEIISWGSMMSLAEMGLLSNQWWLIIIPGIFLITSLVCITNIGNYIRKENNKDYSNL